MNNALLALTNDELSGVCICCGEETSPCSDCGRGVCRLCNSEQGGRCYDCHKAAELIAEEIERTDRDARAKFYAYNR